MIYFNLFKSILLKIRRKILIFLIPYIEGKRYLKDKKKQPTNSNSPIP